MELDQYNPIRGVDGQYLKCPSSYQWRLQDISASDAGRTEDNKMDKKRLGQCVKLELEWKYTTIKEAAAILKAFNPEYINVTYLDAMAGDWKTSEFYVGDRAVPMYNSRMNRWEGISFNIIERAAH